MRECVVCAPTRLSITIIVGLRHLWRSVSCLGFAHRFRESVWQWFIWSRAIRTDDSRPQHCFPFFTSKQHHSTSLYGVLWAAMNACEPWRYRFCENGEQTPDRRSRRVSSPPQKDDDGCSAWCAGSILTRSAGTRSLNLRSFKCSDYCSLTSVCEFFFRRICWVSQSRWVLTLVEILRRTYSCTHNIEGQPV